MTDPTPPPLPYESLPPAPDQVRGGTVMARLLDGLAFRYRWATEDLAEEDAAFRPCDGAMTLGELLAHVRNLVRWVHDTVAGTGSEPSGLGAERTETPAPIAELRAETLETITRLRGRILALDESELAAVEITGTPSMGPQPFWSIINGPLADALTHVGQINGWRRIAGRPGPRADVFRGRPPRR